VGTLRTVVKRFTAQRLLGLAVVVTLAFCVGVMVAGPIYANGAREAISSSAVASAAVTVREARLALYGDERFEWVSADAGIRDALGGLPVEQVIPQGLATVRLGGPDGPSVPLLFRDGAGEHLAIEGEPPAPGEVLVQAGTAEAAGISVGDRVLVVGPSDDQLPLVVSGLYETPGGDDPFWFGSRTPFPAAESLAPAPLVVDRLTGLEATRSLGLSTEFAWDVYLGLDTLGYDDTARVPQDLARTLGELRSQPGLGQLRLVTGLDTLLDLVRQRVANLFVPIMLVAFQIAAVALAVLAGVGALALSRQSFELAVLHSRGFSRRSLLVGQSASALLVGLLALPLGLLLGLGLTAFAARANGDGLAGARFPIAVTGGAVALGSITALVGVAILILLSVPAVKRTVLEERRSVSREERPLLARVPVELIVLPVGVFAFIQLRGEGTADASTGTIDPLVLLAPTLLLMGLAFLALRLLLAALRALDGRIGRARRLSTYLAGRRLARAPGTGFAAALLLLLAFGLLVVSTSYRAIVVRNHADAAHAQVGADWNVAVTPPEDVLRAIHRLPSSASAVLRSSPGLDAGSFALPPTALGVDPATFAETAWWREDYADRSLSDIMADLKTAALGEPVPTQGPFTATVTVPRIAEGISMGVTWATTDDAVRTAWSDPLPGDLPDEVTLGLEDAERLLSISFAEPQGLDLPGRLRVRLGEPAVGGSPLDLSTWTASTWRGSSGDLRPDPPSGGFDLTFTPGAGTVVAALIPREEPLPALVSEDVAASAGGAFEMRLAGQMLPVTVAETATAFPSTVPNAPFVVVSVEGLMERQLRIPEPGVTVNEVWASGEENPAAAIRGAGFSTGRVQATAPIEAILAQLPQSLAVGMNVTAAAGGLALVIVGVASALAFSQRRRDYEFAALRAMGTEPRQIRRAVMLEQATLLVYALVAGGGIAYVLLRLVMPSVGTSLGVKYPPPELVIDWPVLIAAAAAIAAVTGLGIALAVRSTMRASVTGVLRGEAE
jgi:hypothetical protein